MPIHVQVYVHMTLSKAPCPKTRNKLKAQRAPAFGPSGISVLDSCPGSGKSLHLLLEHLQKCYGTSCSTWSPTVCNMIAIWAILKSLGHYFVLHTCRVQVEARKLEDDRRKKEHQHESSYIHVAAFWSLPDYNTVAT